MDVAIIKVDEQTTEPNFVLKPSKVDYKNESPIFTVERSMSVVDGSIVHASQDHSNVVANFSLGLSGSPGAPVFNSDGEFIAIISHTAKPVFSQLVSIDTITEEMNKLNLSIL